MSGLFWLVLAVGMVVIGVVALGQFLGRRNHDRLVQKALSAIEDPNAVRAQLLEAIKAKSANERTVVSLRLFWAGSGIKSHEQYVIMKPLFDDQLIFRSDEVSRLSEL